MNLKQQLDCLFDPQSVAVIGASNDMIKWGFNILNKLLSKGGREIYAVNRKGTEVQGLKGYRNIGEVPGPVDVAVITVPYQDIIGLIRIGVSNPRDCVSKAVTAAIV